MRNSKWSFPYPILTKGRDDYENCSFSLNEENHDVDNSNFTFRFSFELNCRGLAQYIESGKADIILFVESSLTRYRNRFSFDKQTKGAKAQIPKDALSGKVSFTAYIVAIGDTHFKLPDFNQTYYHGISFDIRKGDILAESETITIPLDDSELLKPMSSIFNIGSAGLGEQEVQAIYDDDKIQIFLPSETYREYDWLKRRYPQLRRALSAIITMPALVEAIDMIEEPDVQECRWNRAIQKKATDNGIESISEYSYQYANHIYGNIIRDALTALKETINTIETQEEEGMGE